MSQFSVLHINKYKALGGIGSHIDRRHVAPNVDPSRTHLNEDSVYTFSEDVPLEKSVAQRISAGYTQSRSIRKDAVKALGIILGGTHERMKEIEADERLFNAWKQANYDFVCREFGQENIVRFSLHRDERTPHFHCVVVPITPDGKLSADNFIGTPAKLRAYQDRYASAMKNFGLQRGIHKELTHRKHVTGKDYYKSINALANEVKELTSQIKSSNVFKLDKVRTEIEDHVVQLRVKALEQETRCHYALVSNQSTTNQYSKHSFQKRLEQESSQAYDWIKREIPIADFAVAKLGWRVVNEKSTKRDWVLEHPSHGRIIVPTRPRAKNGHWIYSLPSQKGGGTLIDLLQKEKWDWQAIKALAHSHVDKSVAELVPKPPIYAIAKHIADPAQQESMATKRMEAVKVKRTAQETYLEKRGIAKEAYQCFPQLKTNNYQAVFGLYTGFDDQVRLCSTINYYFDRAGESRKYFQKDLPRGLAQLSLSQDPTYIVITESPIDALSHRQMQLDSGILKHRQHLDKTMYLATCGNLSVEINKSLAHIFESSKATNQEVILSFDNDIAGRKMTQELERLLQEKQCTYRVELPALGKDWNEALYLQGRDHAVQEFLAQDKLYGFPQTSYNTSLLHKAGITQADCAGIHIKAEERSVVFGLHQNIISDQRICSTVTYQWDHSGTERQYFQAGLPRGLAMLSPSKEVQHIIVTSSPLEAIQHRNNNPQAESTLYLCTCGPLTQGIRRELSQTFQQAQSKQQSISLMNLDKQSFAALQQMLKEQQCIYTVGTKTSIDKLPNLLSQVAKTLGTLANIRSSRVDQDDEEEIARRKKRSMKGRSV